MRVGDDRGSATVWVVVVAGALSVVFGAVLLLGQAVLSRHRAGGAADLAALAAADHALRGQGPACAGAVRVARAQGAEVLRCTVQGEIADVRVRARAGPFNSEVRSRAGPATAAVRARAGPDARVQAQAGPDAVVRARAGSDARVWARAGPEAVVRAQARPDAAVARGGVPRGRLPDLRGPATPGTRP
ncbi:Rv3654c family TadE-like protein, partial [Streptomyces sp. E11-3]|uniref:Rv3654c family TadE-like protein n=1 Tax=Streptomyces sp. E11-3 TaxID=3110112 RepID=UPI00397F3324